MLGQKQPYTESIKILDHLLKDSLHFQKRSGLHVQEK